ncbi:MAG: hypothetical protein AAF404_05375, partial [Pseudomonadota bacterium]
MKPAKLLRALIPQKLASQLLALLVFALALAFAITVAVSANAQRSNDRSTRDQLTTERVQELITTFQAMAPSSRQQFAKNTRTRTTSISVDTNPTVQFTADNERSRKLAALLTDTTQQDDIRVS